MAICSGSRMAPSFLFPFIIPDRTVQAMCPIAHSYFSSPFGTIAAGPNRESLIPNPDQRKNSV